MIDCVTRWGSVQKMVMRVLEQEPAIRQLLSADRKTSHLVPSCQDIEVLNAALELQTASTSTQKETTKPRRGPHRHNLYT